MIRAEKKDIYTYCRVPAAAPARPRARARSILSSAFFRPNFSRTKGPCAPSA
jgi:hypothetical protein